MKRTFKHNIDILIFDADDTLWENNIYYVNATDSLFKLAEDNGCDRPEIEEQFYICEQDMVNRFGYGSKVFVKILYKFFTDYPGFERTASLEESFEHIVRDFKDRWKQKPALFPGVEQSLSELNGKFINNILTKGNYDEQLQKIRRSGLLRYFTGYFIVAEKNISTLQKILRDNNWDPDHVCMIGNSPKSDINPALQLGLHAIFIPYAHTWKLDNEDVLIGHPRLKTIPKFTELTHLLLD